MMGMKGDRQYTRQPVRGPQAGATLLEVLVAVGILAMALVILITGLSTGVMAVRNADTLTTATNLAASQLETIKAQAYDVSGAAYTPIAAPAGYTLSLATGVIAAGMQQVTVTVSFTGGAVTISNYKVNR